MQPTIQAAIVAALAALAGVVLGRLLEVWGESAKWLREHRSVAYAAFLGAAERYLSGVLIAKGAADFRSSAQGMELDRIFGDLQLFGSEAARLAASRVRNKLLRVHAIHSTPKNGDTSEPDFLKAAEPIVEDYQEALSTLRSIMKRELRVK